MVPTKIKFKEIKESLSEIFPVLILNKIESYFPIWEFNCIDDLRCLKCNGELIQIEDDLPEILEENDLLDISGYDFDEFVCIPCRRYYSICTKCTNYWVKKSLYCSWDRKCDRTIGPVYLMKFLGYGMIGDNGLNFRPNKPRGHESLKNNVCVWDDMNYLQYAAQDSCGLEPEYLPLEILQKYPEETIQYESHHNEDGIICHYIGDRNEYWLDKNYNEIPTGPDGGAPHFWKCPKCLHLLMATDK